MENRRNRSSWPKLWLCTIAAAALLMGNHLDTPAVAQTELLLPLEPVAKDPKEVKLPLKDAAPEPKKEVKQLKKYSVALVDKTWQGVMDWFAEISKLDFVSNHKPPTGTVSLKTRDSTLPEILDHLNDLLYEKGYMLIRRDNSFGLFPLDDKPDPASARQVDERDLDEQASREMVKVVIPLEIWPVDDVAPQIKKMLGKFSEVQAFTAANQLMMFDQVGNLKRVIAHIRDGEEKMKKGETLKVVLKYRKAREVEDILRTMLGEPKPPVTAATNTVAVAPTPNPNPNLNPNPGEDPRPPGRNRFGPGGGFPGGGFPGGVAPPGPAAAPPAATAPTSTTAVGRLRHYSIAADESNNAILVSGPPDILAKAKKVIEDLDKGERGDEFLPGKPYMKTYPTVPGTAEGLAKSLTDILRPSPNMRIWSVGQNEIWVWGGPQDQVEAAKHLKGTVPDALMTDSVTLTSLDAGKVAEILKGMYGDPLKGAPYIAGDERNAILIRGTADQIKDVKMAIKIICNETGTESSGGGSSKNISIPLKDTSPRNLADALEPILRDMGYNPRVIRPGIEDAAPPVKKEPPRDKEPAKPKGPTTSLPMRDSKLMIAAANQPFVDPQETKKELPKGKKGPILLMGVGNRLLVQSDDPNTTAMVADLVRLIIDPKLPGDYTVLRIKKANASEIARTLDAWFNNKDDAPQPQQGGGGRGRGAQGGGGGGAPGAIGLGGAPMGGGPTAALIDPAHPTTRVKILAHPETNSLLVRANLVDLMTIKKMLADVLDSGDTDADVILKTHMIKFDHAVATEVSYIIKDVFKQYTGQSSTSGTTGGFPGFIFGGATRQQGTDTGTRSTQPTLSVGVDDRSNTLIVNCTKPLLDQIEILCKELDKAAADSARTVKILTVKNLDPALVQQALDAIQGRRSTARSNFTPGTQGGMPGGGGFGGFPGGGGFGGFPGGGGFGGNPGGGFGGNPGGGFGGRGPGGGGFQPGGGGGGPRGGGQAPSSDLDGDRGPSFFESRDMDVPSRPRFYDPRPGNIKLVSFDELPAIPGVKFPTQDELVAQKDPKAPPEELPVPRESQKSKIGAIAPGSNEIPGFRGSVVTESLPDLGIIIINANNKADLAEVERIIKYISEIAEMSQPKVEIVPLEHGDATSIVNILNQVYARLVLNPTGPIGLLPPRGQTTGANGVQGGNLGQGAQQGAAQTTQPASLMLIPLPRLNSIMVVASGLRLDDIKKEIKKLDVKNSAQAQAFAFPLRKASAQTVATMINQFYAQRYVGEAALQHQIRVSFDTSSNQVFVQASPEDLEEIRGLIERIDSTVSNAVNELRVVRLRNALADELATNLENALIQGVLPQSTTFPNAAGAGGAGGAGAGGGGGAGPGGGGGAGPGGGGGAGPGGGGGAGPGGGGGAGPGGGGGTPGGGAGSTGGRINATKTVTLRFISANGKGGILESGYIEDVHLTADIRTNSLIVSAPPKTMELILAVIRDLDVTSVAKANVNIFTLKRADAVLTANLLSQLFYGGGTTGTTTGGGGGGGGGGGAFGGGNAGGGTGTSTTTRPLLSLTGNPSDSANLVTIRISVDERTNSVIVAGTPNDLDTISAIIDRLENSEVQNRVNEVVKLRNAAAYDVVSALQTFYTGVLAVQTSSNWGTDYQINQRTVLLTPEPVTNTILINATPYWFEDIMRMLQRLDAEPLQVAIEVLIAEVTLNNTEEFGVEIGLQTPLVFQRSIIPTSGTTSIAAGATTVSSTQAQYAYPGTQFVNTAALPSSSTAGAGLVGYQGINYLGVGRADASGIGGFVFSAASDSVNVLVRALKIQGRIDVLNTPVLQVMDNQTGYVQAGQSFPYVTGGTVSSLGTFSPSVNYRDTGVTLQITPRISPDGKVLLRAAPSVTTPESSQITLGNNILATAFNVQQVQTTIIAGDGETVVIGGLITKQNTRTENKIPLVGDLPYIGALFRYRTQTQVKSELIVILTPHIIRCSGDADRISLEHIKRMNWNQTEVEKLGGGKDKPLLRGELPPVLPALVPVQSPPMNALPQPPAALPQPQPAPVPPPVANPPGGMSQSPLNVPFPEMPVSPNPAGTAPEALPVSATGPQTQEPPPADPNPTNTNQEKRGWSLFRRDP